MWQYVAILLPLPGITVADCGSGCVDSVVVVAGAYATATRRCSIHPGKPDGPIVACVHTFHGPRGLWPLSR